MEKYSNIQQFDLSMGPIALAIGNFDGIHLGHQKLMELLLSDKQLKSLVVTFEPHPVQVLKPEKT